MTVPAERKKRDPGPLHRNQPTSGKPQRAGVEDRGLGSEPRWRRRKSCCGLRCSVQIRAQALSWDAGEFLDLDHTFRRYAVPLRCSSSGKA